MDKLLKELKATRPPTITVQLAAKIMGVTPRFIQAGLQQGRLPFGTAVQFTRWSYYINTERFLAYMEARDLREEGA